MFKALRQVCGWSTGDEEKAQGEVEGMCWFQARVPDHHVQVFTSMWVGREVCFKSHRA